MNYKEYNINRKLFGENYLVYDWKESDNETHIYVKSQSHIGKCPVCGQESDSYHATYKRRGKQEKKQILIRKIQKRCNELGNKDIAVIMKEFSVSYLTAKKYIGMTEEEIVALNYRTVYKKRKTMLDDYINIIYKMLRDKVYPPLITNYIVKIGYDGNLNTLHTKICRMAKNNFNIRLEMNWAYKFVYPKDVLILKRREILIYITTKIPKTKRDETIGKHIDNIKEKYTIVEILANIYDDFYAVLMGKDPSLLKDFIGKYESSVVEPFISGIKDDITSVMNAISSEFSSGFVEGNNNKFKLIKRILYGRANLDNLFKKCYIAFQTKKSDFKLSDLLKKDARH